MCFYHFAFRSFAPQANTAIISDFDYYV